MYISRRPWNPFPRTKVENLEPVNQHSAIVEIPSTARKKCFREEVVMTMLPRLLCIFIEGFDTGQTHGCCQKPSKVHGLYNSAVIPRLSTNSSLEHQIEIARVIKWITKVLFDLCSHVKPLKHYELGIVEIGFYKGKLCIFAPPLYILLNKVGILQGLTLLVSRIETSNQD